MMTTEMRLENAARRARDERVRPVRLGPGQYVVASSSQPGHGYVVYVDTDGAVACNCPAAQWDNPCKHAVAVQLLEQQDKGQVAA
jgi:uncharacterized Zn finger protein